MCTCMLVNGASSKLEFLKMQISKMLVLEIRTKIYVSLKFGDRIVHMLLSYSVSVPFFQQLGNNPPKIYRTDLAPEKQNTIS